MKNWYSFLFIILLLTGRMAVGQDTGPVGRFGNGVQTDKKPFVGIGVAIPLYKLFSPKKAKLLPVWDKYRALELPDSVIGLPVLPDVLETQAMPLISTNSFGGGVINGDSLGNTTNEETVDPAWTVQLPVVVVTAPAPPPVTGGGPTIGSPYGGPVSIPNPGSSGGGDNGVTETDANGNPMPKPCKEMLDRARLARDATKRAAGFAFSAALAGCGILTYSMATTTAVATAWVNVVPGLGQVVYAQLVTGTIVFTSIGCIGVGYTAFQAGIANADVAYDQAVLAIGPCP